jgi:hypothetical protein
VAKRRAEGRIRRTADEWQALVEEHRASGVSQAAFCARRGIVLSSFHRARRRVAEATSVTEAKAADFVPVSHAPHDSAGWELELSVGERVVMRLRSV